MKITNCKMISFLTCSAMLVLTLVYLGCEETPSTQDLDAYFANNPLNTSTTTKDGLARLVTIEVIQGNTDITEIGQTISLKAVGGHEPYTWSVADELRGTIDGRVQNEQSGAIYTALYTAQQVAQNTIYAYDASGMYGVLNVGPRSAITLSVHPSSSSVTTNYVFDGNETIRLFAVGGTPPYRWDTDAPGAFTFAISSTYGTVNDINDVQFHLSGAFSKLSLNIYVFDEGEAVATFNLKTE